MADSEHNSGTDDQQHAASYAGEVSNDFAVSERHRRRNQYLLAGAILLLFLGGIAWRIRGHRHLTQLRTELVAATKHTHDNVPPDEPRPGSRDALSMTRSVLPGNEQPEFISATFLPGRGMDLLELKASIPDVGEVSLLEGKSLYQAATMMTGNGNDAFGQASVSAGAPFSVPWAGHIPAVAGASDATLSWHGRVLTLPAGVAEDGNHYAIPGLMLNSASDNITRDTLPDGGLSQISFNPADFSGRWPSHSQVNVNILFSGRTVDLTVTVHNSGSQPEPVGIGWLPRFMLHGDRASARLKLPSATRVEERMNGQPTGKLLNVDGTPFDFTARGGEPLGARSLNASFVHLRTGLMDSGPVAEITQPDGSYGIRIIALTSNIRALRVFAPADKPYISIQPNFNYDDPFGKEWSDDEDTGMVQLNPGESVSWKVRLELFRPNFSNSERNSF